MRTATFLAALGLALAACSESGLGEPLDPNPGTDTGAPEGDTGGAEVFPDTGSGSYARPEDEPEDTDTGFEDTAPPTEREETDAVDSVVQPAEFAVDVLFVVDNSCSMEEEQDALTTNFPAFIDAFLAMDGLNYHVGVVSTDMDDASHAGRLREANGVRWLVPSSPDPYNTFTSMAFMGTGGAGDEMGSAAARAALTEPLVSGYNAGFLREQAGLAIIIISDEEDDSHMVGVDEAAAIAWLQSAKPDPAMVSYSTIVPPRTGCATSYDNSDIYHNIREAIGGINASICTEDWSGVLDDLANNAAGLRREFFLDDIPNPATLQVWVIEQGGTRVDLVQGTDYTYNAQRNSVQLTSYTPPPYAEVFIAYDLLFGSD